MKTPKEYAGQLGCSEDAARQIMRDVYMDCADRSGSFARLTSLTEDSFNNKGYALGLWAGIKSESEASENAFKQLAKQYEL